MSIRWKLFIALFLLTLLPYGLVSVYIFKYVENYIRENIENQQIQNINLTKKNISNYFTSLLKNITFWSKAQILDDILTNDVDKRIQIFLDQIEINYHLKGLLIVSNNSGYIVASTNRKLVGKNIFSLGFLESNKYIQIKLPIFASFNKKKIGYIYHLFYTKNLKDFLFKNNLSSLSMVNIKTGYKVGFIKEIPISAFNKPSFENDRYIYYAKTFSIAPLKSWVLISQINKNIVFLPLKEIEMYFTGVFFIGFLVISVFAFYISERLVKPIKDIADTMEYVVKTEDFSKRVFYKGRDEIHILSKSFNYMLSQIEKALKTIEEENKKRLEILKNLLEMFSRITSIEKEEDILNVSVEELRKFFKDTEVKISTKKEGKCSVHVKSEKINRYIVFNRDKEFTEEEKNFFISIGKLINLILEKIELLNKSQQASKAKSAFISNMSHELRTPLNSIIGFSQYLQLDEEDADRKKALKSIETSGKYLLEMINDILDFAKIEAGAVKVNKTMFSIKELFNEVESIIKPLANEKNLNLIFPDEDFKIYTDKKLLKQILLNLLSNAVKFTEEGYIKVSVKKEGDKVIFSVKDTGIGIKKEDLKKLFTSFTQLENPLQKRYKGTGLGLTIAKEYVSLLGGDIYVKSEGEGKGSVFSFYIKEN